MNDFDKKLEIIIESVDWVSKELNILKIKQTLRKKDLLHKKNLKTKLTWERKQLNDLHQI